MQEKSQSEILSHSMVHYLLAIHKLKESQGYARVTDVAKNLGLTKGSVSTALNNLKKKGLVQEEKDTKFVRLSEKGHEKVHSILSSRTLLFYFLRDFIKVEEDTAHLDSCLMEHLMSTHTRERLFEFMKSLSCDCEQGNNSYKIQSKLDLCRFKDSEDFVEKQVGDGHLPEDFHEKH